MIPGRKYTPEDMLRLGVRYKWMIFVPLVVVTAATLAALHWIPNKYRSETLILVVPQRVPETYVKATVTAKIEDRLQSITQQILSRTRLERIIQDFNLYPHERQVGIMEDVVEQMRKDIVVKMVKGDAFRVSYEAKTPQSAMKVTERLASLFIEENLRDREVLADATNQFLDTQLEDSRQRLEQHEQKLEEYRRRFAGQLPSQLQANLQVVQGAQTQALALTDSLNRDRDQLLILQRSIASASEPGADETPAPAPATTVVNPDQAPAAASPAAQLEAARAALAQLQTRLTPAHPDVKRMKKLVAELEQKAAAAPAPAPAEATTDAAVAVPAGVSQVTAARLRRLKDLIRDRDVLKQQIAEKEARQEQLQHQIADYQGRVAAAPTRESELVALTRDYDTLRKVYTDLLAKREESKVAANLERRQIGEQFKILDAAQLPEKPASPNRLLIVSAGAAGGLALGLALVALLEYREVRLRTEGDIALVLNLPVLALVPMERSAAEHRRTVFVRAGAACAALAAIAAVAVGLYMTFVTRL